MSTKARTVKSLFKVLDDATKTDESNRAKSAILRGLNTETVTVTRGNESWTGRLNISTAILGQWDITDVPRGFKRLISFRREDVYCILCYGKACIHLR